MKASNLLNAFVLSALASLSANAATISFTANVAPQTVSFNQTVNLQTFDPALGTLTGVKLDLTGNFTVTLSIINAGSVAESYSNAKGSGSVSITGPGGLSFPLSVATAAQANPALAAGARDQFPGLTATGIASTTRADLANYTGGPGVFIANLIFKGNPFSASGTGGADIFYGANGTAGGSIQVTYTYTPPPPVPDLTITKSHTGNFTAGQVGATYTVTASNTGTASSTGIVTVTDAPPAGITITAMTGTGWTCAAPAGPCTRTDVLASGSAYPAITVTVNVAAGATGTLTNSTTVAGGGEVNTTNDTATDPTTINGVPDLTITKSHTGNFTAGQVGATYTVTASNTGTASSTGIVTVTDAPPAGITITAMAGTGWTCAAPAGPCTRTDILASGSAYPAITVTVNVAAGATGTLTNSTTVAGGGEVNTTNDTATDPTTIVVPDLTITKSHTGNFAVGQVGATYTITPSNIGTGPTISAVTVTDTPPAGITITAMTGTGWTCAAPAGPCTRSDVLAIGTAYPAITVTVNIAANAMNPQINSTTVSGGGEVNTTNDTATDSTTILYPDLTITKSHTGSFTQGQSGATYALTASNIGPVSTTGTVTVADTLPAGLNATAISGTGWTCTLGSLSCTRADALAPASAYPAITVTVNVSPTVIGTLINSATVAGGGEINFTNDTATDPVTINGTPDLTITKSHTGNFTLGQIGATFTITVSNVGSSSTSGYVNVTDTLPAGLTATAITGTGWSCTLSPLSCQRNDALAIASAYPPLTLTVNVAASASSPLTNIAVVSGGGEVNTTNDTAADSVLVGGIPDLTITKTHSGTFAQGQTSLQSGSLYTLVASNVGSAATAGTITVADTLPAGLTATAISGSGWTCALAGLTCTRTDALAVNAAYPAITITVDIAPTATGTLINTATVSGGGEKNLANDSASDPVLIKGLPDMTITKSHTGTFTQGQSGAQFTLNASNTGTAPTAGAVTVTDNMPAGLTATGISGSGWACTVSPLSCTRGDVLATGAAYPAIIVTVDVSPIATGTLTNTTVVAGGGETNTANDTASDPVTINGVPDLTITKSHTGAFTQGQTGATYNVVASNIGTAPTSGNITVTDTLPAGLTATAISGTGWTCTLAGLTCSRADVLLTGAAYPVITVTVNVSATAAGTLVNTAAVAGGGEKNTTNDTASDPTPVNGLPDLTITKSHTGTFTAGQTGATYTVTASNIGTAPTNGTVTVTDTLPAGLTATAISGTGWTCALASLSCTRADILATGAAYPIITVTVTVTVAPDFTGTLINIATAAGGGETNLTNDQAIDYVTISGLPDLTITKSHTGTFTRGGTGTYTLIASNVGAVATTGSVTVVDRLPAGLTATSISGTGWTCTVTPLSCTRADVLAPTAAYPAITVAVSVDGNASTPLTNIGTVSGGGETNTSNNSASDPTPVGGASPSLLLTKSHIGTFVQGGTGIFQLLVTNNGTAPTNAPVTITDPLTPGITAAAINGDGWTCSITTVSCTRADILNAGSSFPPVNLKVNIAKDAPASITNIANVTGGGAPPSLGASSSNNAAVGSITPTLQVTKNVDRRIAQFGDIVGYTIKATNLNNIPITQAIVQDQLPAGFEYVAGSARLISGSGPSTAIDAGNTPGTLTFSIGTMIPGQAITITYRVRITSQAHTGQNTNTAQMSAIGGGGTLGASAQTGVAVTINTGLLTMRQFLVGRVFEDANENGVFDKGERPVAGARVYISNGQSASTDSKGLYNIPSIAAGSVTVALDQATVPRGYTISSGGRKDAEDWSRLIRTPLGGGMILRQNFGIKRCPNCAAMPVVEVSRAAREPAAASNAKPSHIEVTPGQSTIQADGRGTMSVRVRVLDEQNNPVPAKEIRIRTSSGQFLVEEGNKVAETSTKTALSLFGPHTDPQFGQTTELVPQTMQGSARRNTQGDVTFTLLAANTPGQAQLIAETGDPEHLLTAGSEVYFVPEKRTPILVSVGEVTVGRAARDYDIYHQTSDVTRHADAFLRTPLGDNLLTLGYTSHLAINTSTGNAGLFQLDPLDGVYQVFGDSSTRYQATQSNTHVYGRIDHGLSYAMFGDIRTGVNQANGQQTGAPQSFVSSVVAPRQSIYGIGDYNRNLTGALIHIENKGHDSVTVEGARPNTAFARDVFPGSTFGLIQLSHTDILPGSETATLEIRDRHNPELVISREPLVRSADYSLDPVTGGIFFLRTLNAFDQALNLMQVVFTYEYQTIGLSSSVYAIRTEKRFDSWGLRVGLGLTDQRNDGTGSYYLGDINIQQKLPRNGKFAVELPVSHGTALAAGPPYAVFVGTVPSGFLQGTPVPSPSGSFPSTLSGVAFRADLDQPIGFMRGRITASVAKTESTFSNPFGATTLPGSQTARGTLELAPLKSSKLKLGFIDERNKTGLVNNQRQTGSFEWKQALSETFSITGGYDYRDFQDALNAKQVQSSMLSATLDWRPASRFSASVRREQNLASSDPTYPNQTLFTARYQVTETTSLFAVQRFSSAPIIPIGDLTGAGFNALAGKNETSIGIENRWSRYTSLTSRYMIENGINGTDSFAVFGLVNRLPVNPRFQIDLGLERGELISGKDASFNSGSVGFSWLPVRNLRASTRYELRDRGGLGQIFTTGLAGRIAEGLTLLGRFQYSNAAFQPGRGGVDVLSPGSANGILNPQTGATQGTAALAWRPWKTDREGLLFSYTHRRAELNGLVTTQPENDKVNLLSTDGYIQATRRLELYGKFAYSDRTFNYNNVASLTNRNFLTQGRAQIQISHRFDAAVEARLLNQPTTSINQWTVAAEAGFWIMKDIRVGLGYHFRSADEIAASFLTSPIRQGVYFVLSSKLSNMFNLFNAGECKCAAPPPAVVPAPAPKPVANLQISAITGGRDVCPSDNLRVAVTASGWLPQQTPVYQWFLDDKAVEGTSNAFLIVPTSGPSGTHTVKVMVTAGESSKTSAPVNIIIKPAPPPTIRFGASPATIIYGDKSALTATAAGSECTSPVTIRYTAGEGAIVGMNFESATMSFDLNNRAKPQSKVVHLTATATDSKGQTAAAGADVTVTLTPQARRLDDIVFQSRNARVNNCGKRILLEELTPILRNDPDAKVVLIGHRDATESAASKVDEQRVANAAAILTAGTGICPQLDLSRVLINWVGADQSSETRPALCGSSVIERTGQAVAATDNKAPFRRVEIWIIPGGAAMPAALTNLKPAPAARGCPR